MNENRTNPYAEYGCKNRREYLKLMSEEFGVPFDAVCALASVLGESEDFDGLISTLEDYEGMGW